MNPLMTTTVLLSPLLLHSRPTVPQQSALTASWIGSRWGIDPVALEVRRRAGEVFAFREQGSDDWLYPGWQFDDEGNVRPDVARVLAAAREAGIGPSQLAQILNRRSGMAGGRKVLDSLREGDERQVLSALRS
jgi:hypothetical protein